MAGSGWQPRREEGLGTKLKEADSSGSGNQPGWGVCGGVEMGVGEGSPTWCPVSPGMLACVLRPCPRMEGTVLGEES